MTAFIAIYGAILSTVIALLQIRSHWNSQKYIHIQLRRSIDLEHEYIDFIIGNRSSLVTEVREVMIGCYGLGGNDFHMLWARGQSLSKGSTYAPAIMDIHTPCALGPGETLICRYASGDAVHDLEDFSQTPIGDGDDKHSNLFVLEIEHSRSNKPKSMLFEMDPKYLGEAAMPWRSLASLKMRCVLWPVKRHYH
jgi:hypothetical protein